MFISTTKLQLRNKYILKSYIQVNHTLAMIRENIEPFIQNLDKQNSLFFVDIRQITYLECILNFRNIILTFKPL